MSLKTKLPNKLFIEQFIINGINDFVQWSQDNLSILLKDNKIMGYYFGTKKSTSFGEETEILNIYLIDSRHYQATPVCLNQLECAWISFKQCPRIMFVNPPIDAWLDSKQEWCNMQANKLSKKFMIAFEDALSDVYFTIMKCYRKPDVYIGNLNYISNAISNNHLAELRYNKKRINQDSGTAISISTIINDESDDERLTLEDCISADADTSEESLDYKDLHDTCIKMLSDTFGPREIDLILTQQPMYLPRNIYVRLIKWRQKHTIKELYNDETK